MNDAVRIKAAGATIRVRLTPSSNDDRIDGLATDSAGAAHVKARVRAAPEDGEANEALVELLADSLGVAKSSVRIERGATMRVKTIYVAGPTAAEMDAWLAGLKDKS
ncbi:MAG: DUF167 domain-containing protein [Hyphomonadaceae bacterium]|nr:DUF167 domain-containing protein [Hyphomonadaceae bacterium]